MMRFIKLVNFEVSRFITIFSFMIAIIVGCQFVAVYLKASNYVERVHSIMKNNSLTYEQYVFEYGMFYLVEIFSSIAFLGPILVGIAVLIIYVFFIWYRDWFGKATFSYRLLMLPVNRMNIYFAKLATLLLFIFAALAVEVIVMYTTQAWIPKMIPSEVYQPISSALVFGNNDILYLILPVTFGLFLFYYLIGIAAVMVVFTVIIFERSYRLKGIVFGILFAVISAAIILVPIIYQRTTSMLFYHEIFILVSVTVILTCVLSIVISNYLLKYKINV